MCKLVQRPNTIQKNYVRNYKDDDKKPVTLTIRIDEISMIKFWEFQAVFLNIGDCLDYLLWNYKNSVFLK